MIPVHYIVAAYFGPRRIEDPRQVRDRLFFVREQALALARARHQLAKITLVVNTEIGCGAWVEELDAKRRQIWPYDIVLRPNDPGWSYQALIEASDRRFPYTIFTEDDYIFTVDDFDQFLVERIEQNPGVAMVCGAARGEPMNPEINHAAVAAGILRTDALAGVNAVKEGLIPQLYWSRQMLARGELVDWLHHYATAYWHDSPNVVRWFERPRGTQLGRYAEGDPMVMEPDEWRQALLMPVQALDRELSIMYWGSTQGWQRRVGRLDRRGVLV